MRFIRLYILKYKLARIFAAAEESVNRGVEPGEQIYQDYHDLAYKYIGQFNHHTVRPVSVEEFPAMEDLRKLTIKPEPISSERKIGMVIAGLLAITASAAALAGYAAMVHGFYHLFVR